MATDYDVVKYTITNLIIAHPTQKDLSEISLMKNHADKNCDDFLSEKRPSKSQIEDDPEKRKADYPENAWTGQSGELIINQWMNGRKQGMASYHQARLWHELNPSAGDNGSDVPGFPVDIKTSYLRQDNQDLMGKTLSVRPVERHTGNIYVLGLIRQVDVDLINWMFVSVNMIGWIYESDLTPWGQPNGKYPFEGSYVRYSYQLKPMATFPIKQAVGLGKLN